MKPIELDDDVRRCPSCGADCVVEPLAEDGWGVRFAILCPQHGVQTAIDPFDNQR